MGDSENSFYVNVRVHHLISDHGKWGYDTTESGDVEVCQDRSWDADTDIVMCLKEHCEDLDVDSYYKIWCPETERYQNMEGRLWPQVLETYKQAEEWVLMECENHCDRETVTRLDKLVTENEYTRKLVTTTNNHLATIIRQSATTDQMALLIEQMKKLTKEISRGNDLMTKLVAQGVPPKAQVSVVKKKK